MSGLGFDVPYPAFPKRYREEEGLYVTRDLVLQSNATLGIQNPFVYNNPPASGAKNLLMGDDGTIGCGSSAAGGVNKIVAGTNITISPPGGTGDVTINSSGGGGGSVSITAASTNIVLSPATITGTGTVNLALIPKVVQVETDGGGAFGGRAILTSSNAGFASLQGQNTAGNASWPLKFNATGTPAGTVSTKNNTLDNDSAGGSATFIGPVNITSATIYANPPSAGGRYLQVGSGGDVGTVASGGGGGVTSVATNATLSGGPITTSGTLAVSTDFTGYFTPTTTGGAGTNASPYTNADNTGGIQAAITTLSAVTKRGTVWLGSNMYTVSAPIEIGTASNINIKGSNSASTLATAPDVYGTALKLTQGTACAIEINAAASGSPFPRGNQFKDFTVFGGSAGNNSSTTLTANVGIKITGPIDQNIFRDLNFCQCTVCIYLPNTAVADSPRYEFINFDANSYGLYIAPGTIYYYHHFTHNICADMGHVGLFMGSPGGSNPDTVDVDHIVSDNRFVRCAQTAGADPNIPTAGLTSSAQVYLGAAQTIFSQNIVQGSGGIGVICDSANGLRQVLSNNIFDNNASYAIYINSPFSPIISNNQFLINVQGIFISNALNVGQFGAITGNEFQASGSGAGGAAIHYQDIASGSLDHWTTISGNTFASIGGTGPTIYIGNGHSSITVGVNTWTSFLPTTAHIIINNSDCANNIIQLAPNLHITDNGTGTIFIGALGLSSTGLLSAGLANKAVIGGTGTGRVFL